MTREILSLEQLLEVEGHADSVELHNGSLVWIVS